MAVRYPIVPNVITVHLGKPDESVRNITVPFTDYISNVASSELYPTWPTSALTANIKPITTVNSSTIKLFLINMNNPIATIIIPSTNEKLINLSSLGILK